MLFFKRKQNPSVDLSWLQTDIHSHFIPCIDDGAQNMASSLEMIKGMAQLGFKKVITTPHIFWEMYPNTSEIIKAGLTELRNAVYEERINIELSAAAEYFIDEHFQEQLQNKIPLLTIKDNMVLVEISMITAPMDLKDILFEMQLQDYQPLIAHPERYVYLRNNKSFFEDLKNIGCMFQLNLLALTGYYGTSVSELAEYLVKKEFYDYAGTDMHNVKHLQLLQKLKTSGIYTKLQQSEQLKNHLL